ncbi:MAG: AhpC/TSA family [Fibrobacteres bacterium]|nr:AhpC/TSA family [Fibrobacterota bacterium]
MGILGEKMKKSLSATAFAWSGVTRAILVGALLLTAGKAMAIGKVGEMAYEWTNLTDLDGHKHSLVEAKGKVILLATVQSTCSGCQGNAPHIGRIIKKHQGKSFQVFGPDVNMGTIPELKVFERLVTGNDTSIHFPILKGADSQLVNAADGRKWTKYDAYRDVYFVLDHTGMIVYRSDGDRRKAMDSARFVSLDSAIAKAISNVPTTSIRTATGEQGMCLRACKNSGVYQINLAPQLNNVVGNVALRIMDSQGRMVRTLEWNPSRSEVGPASAERNAIWDGKDYQGRTVAWGSYFLSATSQSSSVSLLLSWLP